MASILCLAFLVGIAITYAFINIAANARNQEITSTTANLSLIFEDGSSSFQGELNVGESAVKTFTIENKGSVDAEIKMNFEDLINTYTFGSLSYTLSFSDSAEGQYEDIVENENVPISEVSTKELLADGIEVPSQTKLYYKLSITLNNLPDVDQTSDYNAIFSAHFTIEEGKKVYTSKDTLKMLKLVSKEGTPDFSVNATTDETSDGLYSMEDDYGTSYYFRGNVTNNYIKFGNWMWRILRINGDGSLRIVFDGGKAYDNSSSDTRVAKTGVKYNNTTGDVKYAGFMYGGENGVKSTKRVLLGEDGYADSSNALYNETSSYIKYQLEKWYDANIIDLGLDKYVADSIFCNDRSLEYDNHLGYGSNTTYYGGRGRYSSNQPSIKCPHKTDAFTVDDTSLGNGALKYPVGLITKDEDVIAGGKSTNTSYYLYRYYPYWTMTPDNGYEVMTTKTSSYSSNYYAVDNSNIAMVPVINLKPEYVKTLIGDGTKENYFREKSKKETEATKRVVAKLNLPINDTKPYYGSNAPTTVSNELYYDEDNYGVSYYFRGNVTQNYVKFGDFYWRIIRVNGDGSVRLIYDGTKAHANGDNDYTDRTAVKNVPYNTNYKDNKYVGYMHQKGDEPSTSKEEAQKNEVDSDIKARLDQWFYENIDSKDLTKYLSDTLFCNDRSFETTYYNSLDNLGFGKNDVYYAGRGRFRESWAYQPSFICSRQHDAFTVNDTKSGNGALKYPVGLITKDESVFAGFRSYSSNSNYLDKHRPYWTMTPDSYISSGSRIIQVPGESYTANHYPSNSTNLDLVPVINLSSEAFLSMIGSGTRFRPYRFATDEEKESVEIIDIVLAKLNVHKNKVEDVDFTTKATTDEGIFTLEDDYGLSYFYRGNVTNNYVKFGSWMTGENAGKPMYWRIIRINGNGSIRMIYDGTEPHENSDNSLDRYALQDVQFNLYENDAKYIGYMYGPAGTTASTSKEEAESNVESSNIKIKLEEWFYENIENNGLRKYIDDSVFCNDRTLEDSDDLGYGKNYTLYASRGRYRGKWQGTPSFRCPNKNDAFTVSDFVHGNAKLDYPVGLITMDERYSAGSGIGQNNYYYLSRYNDSWTMSPDSFTDVPNIITFNSDYNKVTTKRHVSPVINLNYETVLTLIGSGEKTDAYRLPGETS